MGAVRRFAVTARRPDGRTAYSWQAKERRIRAFAAPSLPRGNRLVARMKTSPGSGRSGAAFPGTDPVAGTVEGRSMLRPYIKSLPVTVAGARPASPPLPTPPLARKTKPVSVLVVAGAARPRRRPART